MSAIDTCLSFWFSSKHSTETVCHNSHWREKANRSKCCPNDRSSGLLLDSQTAFGAKTLCLIFHVNGFGKHPVIIIRSCGSQLASWLDYIAELLVFICLFYFKTLQNIRCQVPLLHFASSLDIFPLPRRMAAPTAALDST